MYKIKGALMPGTVKVALFFITTMFFFITCTQNSSNNPYAKPSITLILESSEKVTSSTEIIDTTGDSVHAGIIVVSPLNIDSIQFIAERL